MNTYNYYRIVINIYFPEAIIYIVSFHVRKKATDCLNSVRKRMLKCYKDDKDYQEYKLLKCIFKLLLQSGNKIHNEKYFFDYT